MLERYKNIEDNNCQRYGFCRLDPKINALYELLMNEIRHIAFFCVKIKEMGIKPDDEMVECAIKGLCVNFTSINFVEKDFFEIFENLVKQKNKGARIYKKLCKEKQMPYESFIEVKKKFNSINEMIEEGGKLLERQSHTLDFKNAGLFEIVNTLARDCALGVNKIKDYEKNYDEFDFEILDFFNLTNYKMIKEGKLKRKIEEFAHVVHEIKRKLVETLEKNFGQKGENYINLYAQKGKSILVCGDNLKELQLVLEASLDYDINVYTNDMLFMAHSYPKFKKYKNLKGHFGGNSPVDDFSSFEGVIFTTKNYDQKTDTLIRANIFSSSPLAVKGIGKIKNNDFSNLIKTALNKEGFLENQKENVYFAKYAKEEIRKILKENKNVKIIVGENIFNVKEKGDYGFIQLNWPFEIDLLLCLFEFDERKNIEIYFSNCYLQALVIAFALHIELKCKVYFGKCPEYYINPNLIKCLKEKYDIKFND